jgi:hypothetical protein
MTYHIKSKINVKVRPVKMVFAMKLDFENT